MSLTLCVYHMRLDVCRKRWRGGYRSRYGSPLTAMRWAGFAFDAGLHLIVEYIETTVLPSQVGVLGHL